MEHWRFHEYIAVSCSLDYTMPLGLLGSGPYFFKVYRGAGLQKYLDGNDCLLLLAPKEPELFLESVVHELESKRLRDSACILDSELGSWFTCTPVYVGSSSEYSLYECDDIRPIVKVAFEGYHRGYGCLVELLVLYTKARAGVLTPSQEVVEYLLYCMERSGAGGELIDRVKRLLQAL